LLGGSHSLSLHVVGSSALETFVIIALYKSTFTIPLPKGGGYDCTKTFPRKAPLACIVRLHFKLWSSHIASILQESIKLPFAHLLRAILPVSLTDGCYLNSSRASTILALMHDTCLRHST